MTSDPLDVDDELSARITDALRHRAARVAVDDRLDRIAVPAAEQSGPGVPATLHPAAGWRRPAAARLVFAAAAAMVAVALTLALWHRSAPERLAPVITGPTPAGALVYPALDPVALESIGIPGVEGEPISGTLTSLPGPALVLGRADGDRLEDLIALWVDPPTEGAADDATGIVALPGVPPLGGEEETLTLGPRTVRHVQTVADDGADLIVWLDPTALPADVDALRALLSEALLVRSATYVDQEAQWARFQQLYADQPEVAALVKPNDLPAAFELELENDDETLAAGLAQELEARPGVSQVSPNVATERYEWTEAGAEFLVGGAPGTADVIEAVVAHLSVIEQRGVVEAMVDDLPVVGRDSGSLPLVAPGAALPDGWVIVAGPAAPAEGALPVLSLLHDQGDAKVIVSRQPSFDPRYPLTRVKVGDRDGYLVDLQDDGAGVFWPLAEPGHWAQLTAYGLTDGQALALANAVVFTDEATWAARYPAVDDGPTPTVTAPATTTGP